MLLAEGHQPLVQLRRRLGTGRHARIVGPHELDLAQVHRLERLEIRLPSVFRREVIVDDLRADHPGCGGIGRITGVRHQHLITGVDISHGNQQDAFLGAGQRLDFLVRIEGHAIIAGIPFRESLAQGRKPFVVLVAMAAGAHGRFGQFGKRGHGRRTVRRADAQVDDRIFSASLAGLGEGVDFTVLTGEIILLDTGGPVGGLDIHDQKAEGYSPRMSRSSISGRTASRACL